MTTKKSASEEKLGHGSIMARNNRVKHQKRKFTRNQKVKAVREALRVARKSKA